MKKKICLVLLLLLIVTFNLRRSFSHGYYMNISNLDVVNINASYSYDISNVKERIKNSDNIFIGRINNVKSILEYNDTGLPMPYTVYNVDLVESIKGNFDSNVVTVTYYGGIDQRKIITVGNEYKNEYEIIPIIGEYYLFSTIKVTNSQGRLENGMNLASVPFSVIWLNDYSNSSIINTYTDYYYSMNFNDDIVFEDGGGGSGSNDGSSFTNAIDLGYSYRYNKTLDNMDDEIYFCFELSNTSYVNVFSEYTSENTDVKVILYSENYDYILEDSSSGEDENFHVYYRLNSGKYYLKVTGENQDFGSYIINFNQEGISARINEESKLVTGLNSVENYKIVYRLIDSFDYSVEFRSSVALWNELGLISIISDQRTSSDITLYVGDYQGQDNIDGIWSNDGYSASTPMGDIVLGDLLLVNAYYFNGYSETQQMRIIAHELGHALGLHEFNPPRPFADGGNENITESESSQNIMRQMNLPLQQLGPCDKEIYYYLWG